MGNALNKNGRKTSSSNALPKQVQEKLSIGLRKGFDHNYLSLSDYEINDAMIPKVCDWIGRLGNLVQELSLENNKITSQGANILFNKMRLINASIKELKLGDNLQINDDCMKSLGEYIKANKNIELVSLSMTWVSDAGIEILAPYLEGNTTFRYLELWGSSKVTDKSVPLLIKMIESSHMMELGIVETSISQKTILIIPLVENIVRYGQIKMNLDHNGLNDDHLIKICEFMKKYGVDKLEEIDIIGNAISPVGLSLLLSTLKECNSIVSVLDISSNELDDESMKHIGDFIQDNDYLEILHAECSYVTDKGVEILSEYLIGNTTLKELNLSYNKSITDASATNIIEVVKKSHIILIDVADTSITHEYMQLINQALKIPVEQRDVPIKSNAKSAAKINMITE